MSIRLVALIKKSEHETIENSFQYITVVAQYVNLLAFT